jgi:hypothetical protein
MDAKIMTKKQGCTKPFATCIFLFMILPFVLIQCDNIDPASLLPKGVYVAGYISDTALSSFAPAFWQEGTLHAINDNGMIYGTCVSGRDIGFCGATKSGTSGLPCYWKNGVKTTLSQRVGCLYTIANGMSIEGGDIYISGTCQLSASSSIACFWKNGDRVDLPPFNPNYLSEGLCMTVSGSDIYTAGHTNNVTSSVPCYWKNNKRIDLPQLSATSYSQSVAAIGVSGSSVFCAGYCYDTTYKERPCVWIDSVMTQLITPASSSYYGNAAGMCIDGAVLHFAGTLVDTSTSHYVPYYLNKNGATITGPNLLPLGAYGYTDGKAYGISVSGGFVYIAGYVWKGTTISPAYWENTLGSFVITVLPGSSSFPNGVTNSIFIVQ